MGTRRNKVTYGASPSGQTFWYVTVAKSTERKPMSVKKTGKKKKALRKKSA